MKPPLKKYVPLKMAGIHVHRKKSRWPIQLIPGGEIALHSSTVAMMAYTIDTRWRNRSTFVNGRDEVVKFLQDKWARELDYRLIKEIWTFQDARIAVRFAYECHDASGQWYRSYGNENWQFDENGLMKLRLASINDLPINESERKFHWELGPRPEDHPGLTDLGL